MKLLTVEMFLFVLMRDRLIFVLWFLVFFFELTDFTLCREGALGGSFRLFVLPLADIGLLQLLARFFQLAVFLV